MLCLIRYVTVLALLSLSESSILSNSRFTTDADGNFITVGHFESLDGESDYTR